MAPETADDARRARSDGRAPRSLRTIAFAPDAVIWAEGSCRIVQGRTEVLCAASVESRLPPWRRGAGAGWISAEYGMLPRATGERMRREAVGGRQGGRTMEIQRLIGRAVRAVHDLEALGERMVRVDCDVLNADGGTRCASVSGAAVALARTWRSLTASGLLRRNPQRELVAAVSCARVGGRTLLDPDYGEDCAAEVDANFVLTESGRLVEVQMTAEGATFSEDALSEMLGLAREGVQEIFAAQRNAIARPLARP